MFEESSTGCPTSSSPATSSRLRSNFINGIKHMPVRFSDPGSAMSSWRTFGWQGTMAIGGLESEGDNP